MKNSIIPTSELVILGEIFVKIDELINKHVETPLNMDVLMKSSEVEQINIVVYMDFLKDFIEEASTLRSLLETSEEEFIDFMTDGGKRSLNEVKREIMLHGLFKMLAETTKK